MNTAKHSIRREPSARRGWLSSFWGDDISPATAHAARRRLVFAFAVAIALHEIAAAIVPWHTQTQPSTPVETITIAKLTHIEHHVKPTPKPKPTPAPVVRTRVIAPTHVKPRIINPGKPSQHHHVRRIASARPLVHTRYHSKPATVHVPTGGHGAGTSTTAKAETGGIGPGGTGTGESGTGQGLGGAPQAHEPCGYVDFFETEMPTIDRPTGRVWEHIMIKVHFPDGSEQSVPLDYPFYYPTIADDPFEQAATKEATFQFPPAAERDNEPPLVQYVMQHSTPDGHTILRDCPKSS